MLFHHFYFYRVLNVRDVHFNLFHLTGFLDSEILKDNDFHIMASLRMFLNIL